MDTWQPEIQVFSSAKCLQRFLLSLLQLFPGVLLLAERSRERDGQRRGGRVVKQGPSAGTPTANSHFAALHACNLGKFPAEICRGCSLNGQRHSYHVWTLLSFSLPPSQERKWPIQWNETWPDQQYLESGRRKCWHRLIYSESGARDCVTPCEKDKTFLSVTNIKHFVVKSAA